MLRVTIPVAVMLFLSILTGCETAEPKKTASFPPRRPLPKSVLPARKIGQRPAAPKIQEDSKPRAIVDPAEALIAQAEKQYAAGQANYQAGHLEAAKANFDQAFNTLLSSNLDIRNNPRLEKEFDKIVDAVHELEMTALKQGDGFTEQHSEPAPIDEANDITFPVDPERARQGRGRDQDHQVRPAAGAERPGGDVHQLFLQPAREGHAGARLARSGRYQR